MSSFRFCFFAICLSLFVQQSAALASVTLLDQKISLASSNYRSTVRQLEKASRAAGKDSIASCAEITEIPGAIVCAFNRSSQMNAALVRTSFSIAGSQEVYVIPNNDPLLRQYVGEVGGQTVRSTTLRNFFAAAVATTDPNKHINLYESQIYSTFVTNPIYSNRPFAIVAIALDGVGPEIILSHEIHHARMYLDINYNQKINSFWTNYVTDKDKQKIRNDLQGFYGTSEQTTIDEFQAYCLETPNDQNPLTGLDSKYRKNLNNYLGLSF